MNTELRYMLAGTITTVVVVLFSFIIWLILGLRAVDPDSTQSMSFNLESGTGVSELAEELETKGIIRSASAFTWYVTLTGKRSALQAGNYELSPSDNARDIATIFEEGHVASSRLMVPEGVTIMRLRQIAEERGIDIKEFDAALQAQDYPHAYLKLRPQGALLEGYLYPDSYDIIKPIRPRALVQAMLDNFDAKIGATDFVEKYGKQGLNLHQAVTLASIVEKEVSIKEDRAMVAQVYLNRLRVGMPLQADPTVIYAAEMLQKPFDTKLASPFNTYAVAGLPPAPICSPSMGSLEAVANPKANDFIYFIADKTGKTHYAKTFPEHQANVQKYLE